MGKRRYIGLVVLILLAGTGVWSEMPQAVAATSGDFDYSVSGEQIEITEYNGSGGDVIIPETIEGMPVITIGSYSFYGEDDVTGISIPDSVITIAEHAFHSCSNLTEVNFGNNVNTIGQDAFNKCAALTSITIPDSVTTIGDDAFYNCNALRTLTIGNNVRTIGEKAFYSCTALETVVIPDSVTSIDDDAFRSCEVLMDVIIGSGVNTIGSYAFYNCSFLQTAYFLGDAPSIGLNVFDSCADDFMICFTEDTVDFTSPLWEDYPAQTCNCMGDDSECETDYSCYKGECTDDTPPAINAGPFLAAGTWPVLPTDPEDPMVLTQEYDILWTFSDDYGSCPQLCTHSAEYQQAGDSEWIALEADVDLTSDLYAGYELPILSLTNATTYAVRFTVTDCAKQSTQSATYYFRVAITDNPPIFEDGPFLAIGSWPLLPTGSGYNAPVLNQNYDVLWTFSDDYATCSGNCWHLARYQKVGDTTWTSIPVSTDPTGQWYAYAELPVDDLESGLYRFRMNIWDCTGQRANSGRYYFWVE